MALLVLLVLPACSAASPGPTGTPSTSTAGAAPPSTSAPATPKAALTGCPATSPLASQQTVRRLPGGPDDIAVMPQGDIWVSERDGGRLVHLDAQGNVLSSVADGKGPEGLVALSDGKLLVAEQTVNRIDLFNPANRTLSLWLQLGSAAPTLGIDGIGAFDGSTLVVPDSAAGKLLMVHVESDVAGAQQIVATGLGRPVDAAALGDGTYAVALENAPGIVRVDPASSPAMRVTQLANYSSIDDLVVSRGLVYATNLSSHELDVVDPASGAARVIVNGSPAPQGLHALRNGRLLLADETAGALVSVPGCN